jgi:iron complex outermembrane receptor protein
MHGQEGEAALSALDSLLSVPVSAAARHAQGRSEAPASISVVTSEDIQRYGYRTLEDVFRTLPGFYVSNDRNYSYVGTRGFSRPTDYNNRLLLLVDGHTINDRFYGGAAVGSDFGISLDAVDRIELARGPASAVYGTGGMLAVINVVTKSAEAADGVLISAEAGNLGRHGVSMLFGQTTNSKLDITASFNWSEQNGEDIYFPEFDAPESNNGTAVGLDWERFLGGTAGLRYGSFEARGAIGSRSKGVPTAAWETNFGDPAAETWDAFGFAELTYDWQMDPSKSLKVRAGTRVPI